MEILNRYLTLLLFTTLLFGQDHVKIDQQMVATATIRDQELINFFLEAYLIPEEEVREIRFIDATGNGFGEEDLIKCYPSAKTYYLFPSDTAQQVMNAWEFTSNFQSVTSNADPVVFERLENDRAQNAILAGLLKGINRNYRDKPIKIFFERDSNAVVFDMWGYQPDSVQWQPPPPPPRVAETTFDIMHVLRSDTLVISDTTYYDQYYIYRSVVDTLFISETEFRRENERLQTTYQPGLVPPSIPKKP